MEVSILREDLLNKRRLSKNNKKVVRWVNNELNFSSEITINKWVDEIPIEYKPLYKTKKRYTLVTGGRGSLKSSNVHEFLIKLSYQKNQGVLFTRYTLVSAENSIIPEFEIVAKRLGLYSHFDFTARKVKNKKTGSFILFSGIKASSGTNTDRLKSLAGINVFVVEEGEGFQDENAFDTIEDSVRTSITQNRIIWIQNPSSEKHFIYKRFIQGSKKKVKVKTDFKEYDVIVSDNPDVEHIHTTYHIGRKYLAQDWLNKIDQLEKTNNEKYFKKYIGGWGSSEHGGILNCDKMSTIPEESKKQVDFAINYRVKESDGLFGVMAFSMSEAGTAVIEAVQEKDPNLFREKIKELHIKYGGISSRCFVEYNKLIDPHLPFIRTYLDLLFENIRISANEIENRIRAIKPAMDEGSISLMEGDYVKQFKKECVLFPNGDDQLPSLLSIAVIEGERARKGGLNMFKNFAIEFHHSENALYDSSNSIDIGFDQNAAPYSTLLVSQTDEVESEYEHHYSFSIIDEICITPYVREACREFKKRYPNHQKGLWYYGDSSMRAGNTVSVDNGMSIVNAELNGYFKNNAAYYERNRIGEPPTQSNISANRLNLSNPSIGDTVAFIDELLAGNMAGGLKLDIYIHPKCTETTKGMIHSKCQFKNGKVEKIVERENGVEQWLHCSDVVRYIIKRKFNRFLRNFLKGIGNQKLERPKPVKTKKQLVIEELSKKPNTVIL